ncbi:MAG: helix-turn-helix domain-containing protein, partial [Streptomycetaceae bacterium]|nr:helix-turn-helix domain-containing protein [Streptomycetaceae bacterium]
MHATSPPTPTPASPPTDRVVGIIELLAADPAPRTVAEITARLDLNRSTATAVLGALEAAGWVQRDPADRTYGLGPGLLGVAESVHARLGVPEAVDRELRGLAERVGCGVAYSLVGAGQLTFLALVSGPDALPSGIAVGTRL